MEITLVLVVVVSILCLVLLVILLNSAYFRQIQSLQTILEMEREANRKREIQWELERERLLNRAMSKEWETYAQTTRSMVVSGSEEEPYQGMSDLEELRRIGGTDGVGDDFDPAQFSSELGL